MSLKFEKVLPDDTQIEKLFSILKNRRYSISHKNMPLFNEHKNFVNNNPYLEWYLIYKNESVFGSVYINHDNSIGLNLIMDYFKKDIKEIIQHIKDMHKPLTEKKSIRRGDFFINISPKNKKLIKILKEINKNEIQRSFNI